MMRTLAMTALAATVSLTAMAQTETTPATPANVTTTPPAAPATAGPLKIGYTNVNYILAGSPQTKVIKSQLETAGKQYEKAIQDKMKDLEEKYAVYQKNEASMMESIKLDKQNELRTLEQSIRTLQENAQSELKNKEQELVRPELDKIYEGINAVAKENNFTFILNSDQVILYAAENSDVTDMVLKKLGYPKPDFTADAQGKSGSSTAQSGQSKAPAAKAPATSGNSGKPTPPSPKRKK